MLYIHQTDRGNDIKTYIITYQHTDNRTKLNLDIELRTLSNVEYSTNTSSGKTFVCIDDTPFMSLYGNGEFYFGSKKIILDKTNKKKISLNISEYEIGDTISLVISGD